MTYIYTVIYCFIPLSEHGMCDVSVRISSTLLPLKRVYINIYIYCYGKTTNKWYYFDFRKTVRSRTFVKFDSFNSDGISEKTIKKKTVYDDCCVYSTRAKNAVIWVKCYRLTFNFSKERGCSNCRFIFLLNLCTHIVYRWCYMEGNRDYNHFHVIRKCIPPSLVD